MPPPVGLDLPKALVVGWSLEVDGKSFWVLKLFLKCFLPILEIVDFYW